jgi:hypothetical protein
MATEGHRKKSKAEKLAEWDEEETRNLYELKADIEKVELRMRQDRRRRRLCELPMEKAKAKWPVKQLMVIRQRRLLKRWLRYAEDLRATEENMVCYCWPETGKSLDGGDDWGKLESVDGFKYCRLGRKEEIPACQEGNELGSVEDLKDCREDSQGISNGQLGVDQRSLRGLEDCQEGSESIEDCQEGREEIPVCREGNKLGSVEDLKDCREGSQGISNCQLGKEAEMGSAENLVDCQEDNEETLHCQLGNERRSGEDLKDCQEGSGGVLNCQGSRDEKLRLSESPLDSRESSIQQGLLIKMGSVDLMICQGSRSDNIPYCQVGRDGQMNLDQPEELTEQMGLPDSLINSEKNLDQQMQLTEEEHQNDLLMIGGIELFLPSAQEEAENSVVHAATAEQSQLEMTVRKERKLEQVSETAQADEEKNECSEEQLNDFSQQAERAVASRLTAEKEKEEEEHSEEWLDIFSTEAENNATWEVAEEENTDSICLVDLWEQMEALEERVKVQGMHIQQVRLETDEGMGDHDDQSHGQKFLQLWRLQQKNQPLEKLDEAIKEIRS